MRCLSFIAVFILSAGNLFSQSPHGANLKLDCSFCHQSDTWKIDKTKMEFNHLTTGFELIGQHDVIDCRPCHSSLVFEKANQECASCHKDVHQNSVGLDCQNCHSPQTWIVKDINSIHQQSRFPLLGAHQTADCAQCHTQFAALNFQPLGVQCFDCHSSNFYSTASPNHVLANFSTDCEECHSMTNLSWGADNFAHDYFPLTGGHNISDCFQCHKQGSDFTGLNSDCISCHQDDFDTALDPNHIAGNFSTDCLVCHNTNAWIPAEFDHSQSQFPLTGAHIIVNCQSCHSAGFVGTPIDCYSCHRQDYERITDPNHITNSFSTTCTDCHSTNNWGDVNFNHNQTSFPLTGKHAAANCNQCHATGYANTATDCYSCHMSDYDNSTNPNHAGAQFPTNCDECHSTNGWSPAQFDHDGRFFPIYSGKHAGEWNLCGDCHTNPSNISVFSCTDCHEHNKPDMDNDHQGISGYVYASSECFACHPTGSKEGAFNHSASSFPLTGAHISVECSQCHSNGYANTTADCYECHASNFNSTTNPNHTALALSTDCKTCHTSVPGWQPAGFPVHNNFYLLQGAHAAIASQCSNCHNGNYTTTPNTCLGCHQNDYNSTTTPPHSSLGFSTDCETCHSQNAWQPANFNHDGEYFPIYSGKHAGEWNACSDCHTNPSNYSVFSCTDCHEHNKVDMDNDHQGISGYVYASSECFACHPTGSKEGAFNHSASSFPLTGAHISVDCSQCHSNGYANTPVDCYECHASNFNSTTNPNHTALALSTDCKTCHTTVPGWQPAGFPVHNNFYLFQGAHATIASQCSNCHNGNYTTTPNTCLGCHQNDYNSTTTPPHSSLGFSTDCETCHSQNAWQPANFNHDGEYFPIYTGKHAGEWNACSDCHTNPSNYSLFSCIDCHEHNQNDMNNAHQGVSGYIYASSECFACHPTGSGDGAFNHAVSNFPLTGAHTTVECSQCHSNGYANTPTDCYECHASNFNSTTNPNHTALALSTDCKTCHTTVPGWQPAGFPVHNNFYLLQGAHATIASQCSNCHNGNYTSTPNTCLGCHQNDYNTTTTPPHSSSGFGTDCETCHSENAWQPATFNHDGEYFPIYSGDHAGEWNACSDCHTTPSNYSLFSCIDCHEHNQNDMNNEHQGVSGYIYASTECYACHPTGSGDGAFNHAVSNFPLTGAHTTVECSQCHSNGYANTPTACVECHQSNFNNTTNPDHQILTLSSDCQTCHSTNANWQPALFPQHDQYFQLLGRHAEIANNCIQCHNGNYTTTPTQCTGCHQSSYNAAQNPNHIAAGISTECQTCHSSTAWIPSSFIHTTTGFELLGQHLSIQCSSCHEGTTAGLNSLCVSCHQTEYNTAPDHTSQSYPTTCEMCHNSTAWNQTSFNHANTNFPLTGAHINTQCSSCHSSGFTGTPTECANCHQLDFNQSTNPNHSTLGLSVQCQTCHTTNPNWQPALFSIHNNYYQLIGAHAAISAQCVSCHNGNYNSTPETCTGCHQSDYNGTTNPPHGSQNFSNDCLTCHNMNGWTPATFNHSFYPISNDHNNVSCNQCHSQPNYDPQCMSCHQNDFFDEHDLGDPTNCWDCHSTNDWDDDKSNIKRSIELK